MRKPAVAEELDALLEELGSQAFDFEDAGDPVSALGKMREAWELLPEPKLSWDYFGQAFSNRAAEYALAAKDFEEAVIWIDRMNEAYEPHNEATLVMVAALRARYLYEVGDRDGAWEQFDLCYKTKGRKGFSKEHLQFYKTYTPSSPSSGDKVGPESWGVEIPKPGSGEAKGGKLKPSIGKKVDALYFEGSNFEDLNAPQAAVECYVKALKLLSEPRTKWAEASKLYLALGEALCTLAQLDEAKEVLAYALDSPEGDERAKIWLVSGNVQLAMGCSEEALNAYRKAFQVGGPEVFEDDEDAKAFLDHHGLASEEKTADRRPL